MIYLDYAAKCPTNKKVLDVFYETTMKYISNPNSSHKLGKQAKELLDESTKKIAQLLKVKTSEIIYTSGASESNNLAIKGVLSKYKNRGKHIIATTLDHSSVTGPLNIFVEENGYEVEMVNILRNGLVDLENLKELLREDTLLVSIPYVDSEVGIKQPIEEIGNILKDYPNCIFFTDATQAVGKISVDTTNIDLMTIAPHKFYGLNGIGILIKKEDIQLTPLIHGGKSTTIYRSGTPDLALVTSTATALELALKNLDSNYKYVEGINKRVREEMVNYPNVSINSTSNSIPYTLNLSIKGVKCMEFAEELEKYEIYVSTKTACCPTNTISRSVYTLTKDKKLSLSTLRISFSYLTTNEEIDIFLKYFKICYDKLVNNID
jgi:cysteine desulfurase